MNAIQKIFGLDILYSCSGDSYRDNSEADCLPVMILHDKIGSLIPGYTMKRYWDECDTTINNQDPSWNDPLPSGYIKTIPVLIPFPQRKLASPRTVVNLRKSTLVPQNSNINYLDKNNVKNIYKFDSSKLNDILERIKVTGLLTLILPEVDNINVLLSCLNNEVIKKFKHCVTYYTGNGKLNTSKQNSLLFHITFMNLSTCIPVFDNSKIDGVGILCEYIDHCVDNGNCGVTGRGMAVVLSNNQENIITIDGTIIGINESPRLDFMHTPKKVPEKPQKSKGSEPLETLVDIPILSNPPQGYGIATGGTFYTTSNTTSTTWNNY